ncbi:hypothetical protein GQ53DRAFT_831394 [Thozetella sp. PMI_491]|nr:hypothetical protein GQ53DRAFT_831394 [Thozetella sp. PMI_491]
MSSSSQTSLESKERDDATVGLLSSEYRHDDGSDFSAPFPARDVAAKHRKRTRWLWTAVGIAVLCVTNAITFALTLEFSAGRRSGSNVAVPPKGTAPFLQHLPTETTSKWFDATFYDSTDSVYRKHHSMETELAWKALTPSGVFLVNKEDAAASDVDPARNAYYDNSTAGLVGYPVALETFHQIHCLNMLRQNLYFNVNFTRSHYNVLYGIPWPQEDYITIHLDHCADFLRQRLMCTADLGLVPMVWTGHQGRTTGDLKRIHTCRNYEAVRQFALENAIDEPREPGLVKPKPGDYVVSDYI